jgi:hypothetical protein
MRSLVAFALIVVATVSAARSLTPDWSGTYVFSGDSGETNGGTHMLRIFILKIDQNSCSVQREGFQLGDILQCEARRSPTELVVGFRSYENGSLLNEYGIAGFKPGDELFRLKRPDAGSRIVTLWRKIHPEGYPKESTQGFDCAKPDATVDDYL